MELVMDRFEIIKRYIQGKEVLDIGCFGGLPKQISKGQWLHKRIKENSRTVLGVDINEEGVNKARRLGYNLICENVMTMELNKRFDIIIAAELIEHLPDQGIFLEQVKRHLREDGYFILTTPNADYMARFLRKFFRLHGGISTAKEHIIIHHAESLGNLLESYGFKIEEVAYWQDFILNTGVKRKMLIPLLKIWKDMASNIIIVARIKKGE